MKNHFVKKTLFGGKGYRWFAMLLLVVLLGGEARAQVSIPGTKVKFTFPGKWKYLNTEKVDANTMMYLYFYEAKTVCHAGDTTLPFLRIYIRKNYNKPLNDFVFDRWSKEPYQALKDYTKGLGLPATGGMGYIGAYTNLKDRKDYQFRMVYFMVQNTVVEFRLETTKDTYSQMDAEFVSILKSLTF